MALAIVEEKNTEGRKEKISKQFLKLKIQKLWLKMFLKKDFIISQVISEKKKFYEFILVDSHSCEVKHYQSK